MLIRSEEGMPPLGTRGIVVSGVDAEGDCDVLFAGFPCQVPPDTSWVAHRTWLLVLDGNGDAKTEGRAAERLAGA
jgi:hypothetical protein